MISLIGTLIGGAVSVFKGIFSAKEKKGDVIVEFLKTLQSANLSDAEKATALAERLSADANSDSWFRRSIRPLSDFLIMVTVIFFAWAWAFGFQFPGMENEVPKIIEMFMPYLAAMYGIGYVGRTIEKLLRSKPILRTLEKFITKLT